MGFLSQRRHKKFVEKIITVHEPAFIMFTVCFHYMAALSLWFAQQELFQDAPL